MGGDFPDSFSTADQAVIPALPPLVQRVRELVVQQLLSRLPELLTGSDGMFCELSERATSHHERDLYFESLHELRDKRDHVVQRFRGALRHAFERLRFPERGATASLTADAGTLSLVGADDMEQHVAITAMTSKARAANQEVLYQLTARLRSLLPGITLNDGNNPLDPAQLSTAFRDALECLHIGTKARLLILKLFDRDIMAALPGIYREADRTLADAGALPGLTSAAEADTRPASPAPHGTAGTAIPSLAETPAGELLLLLAAWRARGRRLPAFIDDYSSRPAPLLRSDELIHQIAGRRGPAGGDRRMVRNTLASIMAATGGPRSLAARDEDVINLVAAVFDNLLSDDSLAPDLRAILGRLQLPFLRLALRDPGFLGNPDHPARGLINDIGRLGVGFHDHPVSDRDPILRALRDAVATIEHAGDLPSSLFEQIRAKLAAAAHGEHIRADRAESRVRETAAGQARTQAARERVLAELQQRLLHTALPQAIATFLLEQWQALLLLTLLRHGEASTEWLESLQLVDDLVWCSQYHRDARSQARQARLAPALRTQIREGLSRSVASAADLEAVTSLIDGVQDTIQRSGGGSLQYVTIPPERLGAATGAATISGWQDAAVQERHVDYEYIRAADRLATGDWLAYRETPGGPLQRCKLAAKLPETDCYVFVDRLGVKVQEKKRRQVACDLQLGHATLIDTSPLFERTLNRLLTVLGARDPDAGR